MQCVPVRNSVHPVIAVIGASAVLIFGVPSSNLPYGHLAAFAERFQRKTLGFPDQYESVGGKTYLFHCVSLADPRFFIRSTRLCHHGS